MLEKENKQDDESECQNCLELEEVLQEKQTEHQQQLEELSLQNEHQQQLKELSLQNEELTFHLNQLRDEMQQQQEVFKQKEVETEVTVQKMKDEYELKIRKLNINL
jgi:hypothetical protein